MRNSQDFDKPGYWQAAAAENDETERAQAERTGLPVDTVARVMADFFANVYRPDFEVKKTDDGIIILDQWGQGVCVYPDGSHHAVGG